MDTGERTTGTRDKHYDLVSVLYHVLHGAENCNTYAMDAEATGRDELANFLREAQATQSQLAERAKMLLGIIEAPPEGTAGPDIPRLPLHRVTFRRGRPISNQALVRPRTIF